MVEVGKSVYDEVFDEVFYELLVYKEAVIISPHERRYIH